MIIYGLLVIQIILFIICQGFSAQTDGVCSHKAHGSRSVRLRLRRRARSLIEPCLAKHFRDVAPSRAGVHGRR